MRWISVLALSLLLLVPQIGLAQANGTIAGTVTGTGGQPLAGASVAVAGTTLGTQTGADGRFTITAVPAGARTLRATFAGFAEATRPVTVVAGQTATVNIQLTAQVFQLEGVVATGYATQRRQDVTGAVVSLQTENIENLPIRGATQALTAQVPGVSVITPTGAPGAGAQVQIRGVTAIGAGSTPLYVVDGFPISTDNAAGQLGFVTRNPLNDIPPGDIESITVLKDASAAAIYGSRAANGVVIITTRRGQASDRPRIDINAWTGVSTTHHDRWPQVATAAEFATFMNRRDRQILWQRRGFGAFPAADDPEIDARWRNPAQYGAGTDWFREITQTAPSHNVSANISGGSERVRSFLSAGYLHEEGVVINSGYRRMTARANVEANLAERLTLGFILAPTYSIRSLNSEGGVNRGGGIGSAMVAFPTDAARDEQGVLVPLVFGTPAGRGLANPVIQLQDISNDRRTLRALGTTFLNWELLDGLTFRTSLNVDMMDEDLETFNPSTIWGISGPSIPSGAFQTSTYLNWLNENTITFDRQVADAHRLQVLGGFTAQHEIVETGSFTGTRFPDDDIRTLNAAETITGNTGESEWSMASVLGRVNYTLLERYVFTATLRADGSSRFGADNRWGTFPSAAVAWNLSRENFMQNVGFMQDAKLRASLGYTGNNQIGNYPSLGVVNRQDAVFGQSLAPGRHLNTLQNPGLGWERTREVNLGLDAFFMNHRIGLVLDAYQRNTQDLLLSLELPTTSGFGSVVANQGEIQNRGFEVGLNTRNFDTQNFRWNTNANLSINRTKALDLGGDTILRSGASMEGANTHITIVGQPIARFIGYRIVGVYTQQDINNACVPGAPTAGCVPVFAGAQAGDPWFEDINGDGIIRQTEDFTILGTPHPRFTWGLTNNMTYGPVDFRATIDGSVGGQRLNRNLASIENIDGPFNVSRDYVQNMWISPDSVGDGVTPAAGHSSTTGRRMFRDTNDRWVEDASFVWVRNVMVRYQLPENLTGGLARRASLYTSINNPFLFSSYHGNPQAQSNQLLAAAGAPNSPNLTPGVEQLGYPISRTFTVGIDLGL
jgi:TonB-dependent starch-binding outer membrane protein SusC